MKDTLLKDWNYVVKTGLYGKIFEVRKPIPCICLLYMYQKALACFCFEFRTEKAGWITWNAYEPVTSQLLDEIRIMMGVKKKSRFCSILKNIRQTK